MQNAYPMLQRAAKAFLLRLVAENGVEGRRLLDPDPDRDRRDRTNHAPATNRIEASGPFGAALLWMVRGRPGLHSGF